MADGRLEDIDAALTVAADGRGSRLRRASGLPARATAAQLDLLWFRIPRTEGQPGGGFIGPGGYLIALERGEEWQIGFVIEKGSHPAWRSAGVWRPVFPRYQMTGAGFATRL